MTPKKQEKIGVVRQIVVAVAIALLAGGTAPWWWNEIFRKSTRDNTSPTTTPTPPVVRFTPSPPQTSPLVDSSVNPSPSIIASPTPMPLGDETRFFEIVAAALKI